MNNDVAARLLGQRLILRTDGGARGNPGPAAAGAVIETEDGVVLAKYKRYLGILSNNQAEYQALILGLRAIALWQPAAVQVRMDSELIVKQMNGEYRVKAPHLLPLYTETRQLVTVLPQVSFLHVPRAQNHLADALANEAMDEQQQ